MLWILFAASALIAYAATGLSIQLSLRRGVLDLPNVRSSHSKPIPRLGGIGIVLGSCLPIATYWLLGHLGLIDRALSNRDAGLILLAGGGMAVTGLYDDLRHLNPGTKLLIQLGLAALVVISGARIENVTIPLWRPLKLGMFSSPITILWLTGFSNVYNFMDGINGLAAGTGAVYGLFFFLFAWVQGNQALGATAVLLSGSCLGFLYHNFPQARTFMGDTGSLFLGMMFAFLAVRLAQQSSNPASLAALLLVCSVYLYDSAFTVLRRIKHGENILQAHRSHLYQRLAQAGLPHVRITYLYLLLHALVGILGLSYVLSSDTARLLILGFASSLFLALTIGVYWFENRVAMSKARSAGNPFR